MTSLFLLIISPYVSDTKVTVVPNLQVKSNLQIVTNTYIRQLTDWGLSLFTHKEPHFFTYLIFSRRFTLSLYTYYNKEFDDHFSQEDY